MHARKLVFGLGEGVQIQGAGVGMTEHMRKLFQLRKRALMTTPGKLGCPQQRPHSRSWPRSTNANANAPGQSSIAPHGQLENTQDFTTRITASCYLTRRCHFWAQLTRIVLFRYHSRTVSDPMAGPCPACRLGNATAWGACHRAASHDALKTRPTSNLFTHTFE
jgi:hypothetical protein